MPNYQQEFTKYKTKYLNLKSGSKPKNKMSGGGDLDPKILKKIDEIAEHEIKTLKVIEPKDFSSLTLRVHERKGKKEIGPIQFIPPKISEYVTSLGLDHNEAYNYGMHYEFKYGDITKHQLKDLILDFKTNKDKVKVAFYGNYMDGAHVGLKPIKEYFEVKTPIKFLDFLDQLFDHFDKVGLYGYPDHGGIDCVEYYAPDDIYLIHDWS